MARVQVEIDSSPTMEFYPPQAPPYTSATIEAYDSAGDEFGPQVPATVDSLSQDASASVGDTEVTVEDSSAFTLGERYWGLTAGGRGQTFVVLDAIDATTILVDQPLRYDIASVKGARIYFTIPSSFTAEEARGVVGIWRYTAGGLARTGRTMLDIVAAPLVLDVTEEQIESALPEFGEDVGAFGGWRKLKDRARADVLARIGAEGIYPDAIVDRDSLEDAMVHRVLALFFASIPDRAARHDEAYRVALSAALSRHGAW